MLKFRKIFILLFIYVIITMIYLFFVQPDTISLDFFYTNKIFLIIYILLANLFVEPNNLLAIKLHLYNTRSDFFKSDLKELTINNFIIFIGISILNCLMLIVIKAEFNIASFIYYFINLFLIVEIIDVYIISFCFKQKITLIRYAILLILLIILNFGNLGTEITPINIFKYLFYVGNWYEIIIHYLIWLLGGYLLIDYNKRVEL